MEAKDGTSFHPGRLGLFIFRGSVGSVTPSPYTSLSASFPYLSRGGCLLTKTSQHRNRQPICGLNAKAVLFLQSCRIFSKYKSLAPTVKFRLHLQEFLLSLVVPVTHKTISASHCPLDLGADSATSSGLPPSGRPPPRVLSPCLDPARPLQASLPAASLQQVYLLTVTSFQMGRPVVLCRMDRLLCSVRSWEKHIGEALYSVDLNHDVGGFLPVGPSAQSFRAPEGTG